MNEADILGLDPEAFEAVAEHLEHRQHDGLDYRHLPDYHARLERGTVLIGDTAVRGFPKIPRTLVLEAGLPRHFDGPVAIEEKLDGYNLRVARIGATTLAFSRSGHVCPFSTYVVRDRIDLQGLFDAHPEVVVCGEMIGPENPYTPADYPGVDSIAFRAFDLRDRESGEPWGVERRRETLADHGVEQVRLFDICPVDEAAERAASAIEALDAAGREGVVCKAVDGDRSLKYTTAAANRGDLSFAFSFPFDYGRDFMFRRLLREAFQAVEFEGPPSTRERAHALGEAILEPMVEAIETVDAGAVLGERHTVRAPPTVVDGLFAHFETMGLTLEVHEDHREGADRVVTFSKVVRSSTDRIDHYLAGGIVRE